MDFEKSKTEVDSISKRYKDALQGQYDLIDEMKEDIKKRDK